MNPFIYGSLFQPLIRKWFDAYIPVRSRRGKKLSRRSLFCEQLERRWLLAVGDLRIVDYNVLGYSGTPSSDLGTVLKAIGDEVYAGRTRPLDVLTIQEVESQATTTAKIVSQLNALYGVGRYASGTLNGLSTAGNQTVALIYNTQTITLVSEVGVGTVSTSGAARQPIRYQLRPIGVPTGNDFYIYNSHYKATGPGTEAADAARRNVEAQQIRLNADSLGQGVHIIYAGDYNTKSSSEASFQTLLGAGNGQAFDPLNRLGSWSGNSSFRDVFTQAPAVNPPSGFVGGGLNDRFDFQLQSNEWTDGAGLEYVPGTYRTFANNGTVSLNGNINSSSNTALASLANRTTILNLLTTVTDHLPVVSDYTFVSPSLNIALSPISISENGGTAKATITRSGSTTNALTVSLSSSDTSAASLPASAIIQAGSSSVTVTITAVNDTIADGDQTTTIAATGTGVSNGSAILTVTDDEVAALTLSLDKSSISENNGFATATVTRNTPKGTALSVGINSSDLTAASVPSTVTIPAGATSVTFLVSAVDDLVADGSQMTNITVRATGLASSTLPLTVVDDEIARLALSVDFDSLPENGGVATGTVSRNTPTQTALVVTLANSNPLDIAIPTSVTIPAGASQVTFSLKAIDNLIADGNRAATVTASAIGHVADLLQVLLIDNETAGLVLKLSVSSISEHAGGATGTVQRNTPNTNAMSVSLSNSDSSAANIPLTVTIPAGADSVSFAITAIDDLLAQGDRTIEIGAAADTLVAIPRQLTVVDDEIAKIALLFQASQIPENGGTTVGTISRNTPAISAMTITLKSSDPTAATVPASVVIPAGLDSVQFNVNAVDDALADGNQATTITATSTNVVGDSQILTVKDDETPVLLLNLASSTIPENGGSTLATLRRNTPTQSALTVNIVSNDISAATVPSSVTIPPGLDSISFNVLATDDDIVDGMQSALISATADGFPIATRSIDVSDDDLPALRLSFVLPSISENGGTTRGTIYRNTLGTEPLTVNLSSSDQTAATVPLSVVIPKGASFVEFVVSAIDDLIADGNQTTTIQTTAIGHAPSSANLTIEDDEVPSLFLTIADAAIVEGGGKTTGTVRRNSPATDAILVLLTSSDDHEANVPKSVLLPLGVSSVTFQITGVPDGIVDADKQVQITADFSGYASGTGFVTVLNADAWTWTNPVNALDTDDDKSISPLDVLVLINELNSVGSHALAKPFTKPPKYFDVDRDLFVSPLDVLAVVNYLNAHPNGASEGEAGGPLANELDLVFSDDDWSFDRLKKKSARQFAC